MIRDPGYNRCIRIEKESAVSSVVWNPGPEIIKGFADMNDQAWPKMLCVEAGNVLQNAVTVPPSAEHYFSDGIDGTVVCRGVKRLTRHLIWGGQ